MGPDNPTRPIYQTTPFASAPPTAQTTPFAPAPPVAGGPTSFRPASGPPTYTAPTRFAAPPPMQQQTPPSAVFQRFPTPSYQAVTPPPPSAAFRPVPMGSPPPSAAVPPPPIANAYPAPARPSFQPPLPGYIRQSAPSSAATFQQQPPLMSYPPGPPPVAGPVAMAGMGLAEDFASLSLGSVPGSMDPGGLDPKSLPRPLEEGDLEARNSLGEAYSTNCHPRYMRLTTNAIPSSQSLASRWHLPLGAVVCPLAEAPEGEEVPVINFVSTGIIRCRRCRTYVNPHVTFTDSGRKWRCNICSLLNDVPGEYFAHLDATGRRIDLDQRPELTSGSVEFVAPTEYMVRPPMPPLYFFLIDVSISAAKSGMVEVVAQTIRSCLDDLPGYPRTQVGFITYDSTIHFYNMKSSLTQPQMMVVSDLDDIFIPLPDDLLVNLSESRNVVEAFLDSLPSMFQDNMNLESAFGPALKAAFMIMSQLGGKLLIFQNTMPSLGVGRLKLRGDDPRVYGTDREYGLRVPEDPFYKQMAADLTKYQIGVNVYAFSDKYTDLASLGTLAKYTGGQVYYYQNFQAAQHGEKLRHELRRDLTRETAWEAVMRVRCGKGIKFTTYHGHFMLRSTDLLALPAVDCDKAFGMVLSLEETLLTTQTVYFQVALLYTASCGERRIRVHTVAAPVVADLAEMYHHADTPAIVSVLSRLAIEKTYSSKLEDARSAIQLRIVKSLREYRNLHSVQHRLIGRMIYPESLKFLALYGLALCKSKSLRGGADIPLDDRCATGFTMMALPVKSMMKLLYPTLIRVDDYLLKPSVRADGLKSALKKLPLTMDSLDSRGLYIFDDGLRFVIWFGKMLSPDVSMNLLGPEAAAELSKVSLTQRDTEMSRRLIGLIKKLRDEDVAYHQVSYLVRQGEQPREVFYLLANLVEDQNAGVNGYIDWLLQIHRQVQQNA